MCSHFSTCDFLLVTTLSIPLPQLISLRPLVSTTKSRPDPASWLSCPPRTRFVSLILPGLVYEQGTGPTDDAFGSDPRGGAYHTPNGARARGAGSSRPGGGRSCLGNALEEELGPPRRAV